MNKPRFEKSAPKKAYDKKPFAKKPTEKPGFEKKPFAKKPTEKPAFEKKPFEKKSVATKQVIDKVEATVEESEQIVLKGRHEVVQALESAQKIETVYISLGVKGPIASVVRGLASKSGVPVKDLPADVFGKRFGDKSQGFAAVCGSFEYCTLEKIIEHANSGNGIIVALNGVEDARNLGAIVRTVEASGCSGVIIPKHRCAGMTEWAMRTAQGAASYLPVARVGNLSDALEELKEENFWVVGLEGGSSKKYNEVVYNGKVVLVAGGEDVGLGERVKKCCDDLVSIPLVGKTPSLNVSVSLGIALYEVLRQKSFFVKNI